jgi:hypothetical protein
VPAFERPAALASGRVDRLYKQAGLVSRDPAAGVATPASREEQAPTHGYARGSQCPTPAESLVANPGPEPVSILRSFLKHGLSV